MNRDNNAVNDDVLFDDWATRDPAIYARAMRAHVFAFVLAGVLSLIAVIASFFFVYLFILAGLFALTLLCLLYQFLRIKNGHIQIYKDEIVIVNAFGNKKVTPYVKDKTSLMIKRTFANRPTGIVMTFLEGEKITCKYKDYLNVASMYQAPKTPWEIGIKALGLKIIDPQEIIKND